MWYHVFGWTGIFITSPIQPIYSGFLCRDVGVSNIRISVPTGTTLFVGDGSWECDGDDINKPVVRLLLKIYYYTLVYQTILLYHLHYIMQMDGMLKFYHHKIVLYTMYLDEQVHHILFQLVQFYQDI